jgi:hypothetical protein
MKNSVTLHTRYGDVFARAALAAALLGLLGVRLGRVIRTPRLGTSPRPEGVV